MVRVTIVTEDADFTARRAVARDGRNVTIEVDAVEPVTFAGRAMVRFDLGARKPSDWGNRWALVPATHVQA